MRSAVEYGLFTLQQLQAHICGTQITRYADKVILSGTVAIYGLAFLSLTYAGDAYGQAGK